MNNIRSNLPIIHGTSVEVPARDVVVGDHMAIRNSCGGLARWAVVTEAMRHRVITTDDGLYVVGKPTELVEVRA